MGAINFKYLFLIIFLFNITFATAQTDSSEIQALSDDTLAQIFYSQNELLRQLADSLGKEEIFKNKEKQTYSQQLILLSAIGKVMYKVRDYYKEIDTASINSSLNEIENEYKIASNGINDSINSVTERNLSSTSLLLKGLQIRLDSRKKEVGINIEELEKYRKTIDSLENDTIFYKFAKDSVLFIDYFNKLIEVSRDLDPIDNSLTQLIKDMHTTLTRINDLSTEISNTKQEILDRRKFQSQNIFSRDSPDIWDTGQNDISMNESFNYSYSKASLLLIYYLRNNLWRIILLFIGFLVLIFFIYRTRKKFSDLEIKNISDESGFILTYPLLSSAYLCLIFFEFIFTHPPVIFQGIIWILSSLILTIILWKSFSRLQRINWLYLFFAFTIILISDLILKESNTERWFLLLIAVSGIAAGVMAIKNNVFKERNKTAKIFILALSVILIGTSIISNIFGRFNLTKTLLTVSFFILISAYLLYWGMILAVEIVNLFTTANESTGNENFRNKINSLKIRTPAFIKILLFIGWVILIARNFYIYEYFMDGLVIFLEEEITVGDFTFSLEKILIFILILFLSTVLSKLVSFFADSTDSIKLRSQNKAGLSNWMLLIRIAIISSGILLAFAATGIPLDKMTIIIGSLGVGIGLGLQALVNNLVSGVLLAFEKPFQIGDYIEIMDKSGRIKEIGIRSSKISTSDGSEVIIPNGDLLSKHVINWTRQDSRKRSELLLEINSLENTNDIRKKLQEIIDSNENIYKVMPVSIMLDNFTGTSSQFKISYWTDIDKSGSVKSDIMHNVKEKFYKSSLEVEEVKEVEVDKVVKT